jgi:4-aminobutyrate aminotransferase
MRAVDVISRRTGKPDPALREKILKETFNRGVILLGCGEAAIRFCPPLCINEAQLDVGLKVFAETLASMQ